MSVLAQGPTFVDQVRNPLLSSEVQAKSPTQFFGSLLTTSIGFIFVVACIIFVFMFLWGAVQWIASGGDKGNVESAKGRITSALIGLVVLFSTFAIASLIEAFTQVNILTIDIGPLKIQ
jgi:hypothetical protein